MSKVRRHPADRWTGLRARCGFTLLETLVTVLVIGVILTVVITGLRGVALLGRDRALTVTARNLGIGVTQFEQQFGFLPPLVHDGNAMSVAVPTRSDGSVFAEQPVDRSLANPQPAAYSGRSGDLFLRGYETQANRFAFDTTRGFQPGADERYSKYSLAYYVIGALGQSVDGVEGAGFRTPRSSGSFGLGSEAQEFDSFFDAGRASSVRLIGDHIEPLEYGESGRGLAVPGNLASATSRDAQALVDGNERAFRYYRWESGNPNAGRGVPEIGDVTDQNIPSVLLDVGAAVEAYGQAQGGGAVTADPTAGETRLRSARWAIVGAGADGLFGTEAEADLRRELGVTGSADLLELRQRAREDNIVEVGG